MTKVGGRSAMILVFVLVMLSNMAQPGLASFYFNWKYYVHLLNRLSTNAKPLILHVRSGDNDLGEHTVWRNDEFQFHFKLNFWESTQFYCDFKHGNKTKRFDIFVDGNYKSESVLCKHPKKTVYWKVKDDGFYRSCDDKNYEKLQTWNH